MVVDVIMDLNKELIFFAKIQKKIVGVGLGGGGQGGCERRSEVFVKFKKKIVGVRLGGIRVDVNGAGIGFEGSGRL